MDGRRQRWLNQGRRLCLNLCLNLRLNRGLHGWLRGRLWGRRHLTKGHGLHGRLHLRDLRLGVGLRDLGLGLRWHQDLRLCLDILRLHLGRLCRHPNDRLRLRPHRRRRQGLHSGLCLSDLGLGLRWHHGLRLRLNILRLHLGRLYLHLNDRLGLRLHRRRCHGLHGGLCLSGLGLGLGLNHGLRLCL